MSRGVVADSAFAWSPPADRTDGDLVARLSAELGLVPDAGQLQFLDAVFAMNGVMPSARDVALVCPRQNMKTAALAMVALGCLFVVRDRRPVVWTAHLTATAREAFLDLESRIGGSRWASKVKFRRVNGEQEIETDFGSRLLFRARSGSGSIRGLTISRLILDEAYALTAEQIGAMLPAISTVADAQVLYASSAGRRESVVLRQVRDRGRKGGDPSLAYLEWCAPDRECAVEDCLHVLDTPGCVLDDEDLWRVANPALGSRIALDSIRAERRSLPPEEFMRERLGWWDKPLEDVNLRPIDVVRWNELADETSTTTSPMFGLAASGDSSMFSVSVAGPNGDGRTHVELAMQRRGSDWVVDWLVERCLKWNASVALDARGPAAFLIPDLMRADVRVLTPSPSDYSVACSRLADDVVEGRVCHSGQPQLASVIDIARRRPFGALWMFQRGVGSQDISALEALVLAKWAASANSQVIPAIY